MVVSTTAPVPTTTSTRSTTRSCSATSSGSSRRNRCCARRATCCLQAEIPDAGGSGFAAEDVFGRLAVGAVEHAVGRDDGRQPAVGFDIEALYLGSGPVVADGAEAEGSGVEGEVEIAVQELEPVGAREGMKRHVQPISVEIDLAHVA